MELQGLWVPILWSVFLGGTIVSAAVGLMLSYHWMRFSASPAVAFFSVAVYAAGCVVLLGIMFASIITL